MTYTSVGHDLVHALQYRVSIKRASHRGARAHGDHPLGIRHLIVDALHDWRHFQCDCPGHNHQVALPRAGTKHLGAEARNIKTRRRRRDHLDRAARQPECHRPNCGLPCPVEHVVHGSDHEILFELILQPAHEVSPIPVRPISSILPHDTNTHDARPAVGRTLQFRCQSGECQSYAGMPSRRVSIGS